MKDISENRRIHHSSASTQRSRKLSLLATAIVSWNIFGGCSVSINSFFSSTSALLIVKGFVASSQTWLSPAYLIVACWYDIDD